LVFIKVEQRLKRKWTANYPTKLCCYWERGSYDRMLNRSLEADDEFVEWCFKHCIQLHQDWVECPDEATMTLFVLKWM